MGLWKRTNRAAILAPVFFLIVASPLMAQRGTITGRIIDEAGNGLPGANVQIENTTLGASTDLEGNFVMERVPFGSYRLRMTMIGFQSKTTNFITLNDGSKSFDAGPIMLKEAPIEIDPVVVTASRSPQAIAKTPATVAVLTGKEILARNPVRIEDALETAPGVQIIQESVSIRGSDGYTRGVGSRVLVMVDDVPVMNSDFGAVNWFMISPADIARSEIVRGAGSALYGSSAMGGVINFFTRDPGPKSRTYARALFGAFDNPTEETWDLGEFQYFHRQDFTHSRQIGNLGLRISGGRAQSTGFTENSEFTRYNLSGKLNYRFPNASRLTLFGNYMHDDSDVFIRWKSQKEATRVPVNERDKEQTQNGVTLFAKYALPLSSKVSFHAKTYFNRFLLGTQVTSAGAFAPALGLGGGIQLNYVPNSAIEFVYGEDYKFDQVESDTSLYGQRDAVLTARYAQIQLNATNNFAVTLGGRYDRYEIFDDTNARFGEGRVYEHFSPKLGLVYNPFESSTIKASIANGYKFPVVAQLFLQFDAAGFTFRPSPDLQSEESWTYEVGFRQKVTPSWFFEINGFYTDVNNLIEPEVFANLEARFVNFERVRIPGVEFAMNARWWENRLGLRASLIFMDPRDEVKDEILPYRQKFIAFLGPSLRLGSFELQMDYKYGSAQKVYQLSSFPQLVPQKVLDTRLFYYLGNHSFFVGVNNTGNYNYTLRDESLEEIRNFVGGFSLEF